MDERDIARRLRRAIEDTVPDGLDRLLSDVDGRKGVIKMTKRKNRWIGLVAAVLALALIGGAGGLYYRQNYAVATVVSLDVNPSIELNVSRAEKVLSCTGLNDEGREILSTMGGGGDLEGAKLNVAVNAIVGAIVRAGYLDSLSSAILISVEDNDTQRGERLQAQLVAEVDEVLKISANSAGVLSQSMTSDKDLDRQAQENNISSGKAALVNQVIALNSSLDFSALAGLSVEELRDLISIGAPAMPIGREEALRIAQEAAGLTGAAALRYEVDPELDGMTPHYEVELESAGTEYEYKIHAFTGDVLTSASNVPHDPQYQNPSSDRVLSAQEAFNAAAEQFHADYPELAGYNIFDIDTEYKSANNTYEVDFDVSGWDFEYLVDAATGAVVGGHTDYRTPQPDTQTPAEGSPTVPENPPADPGAQTNPQVTDIGEAAAKAAALARAGISGESSVTWIKCQREYDDGRLEYDIEFTSGNTEYDVTVDAASGNILSYETEPLPNTQPPVDPGTQTNPLVTDIGEAAAKAAALAKAGISGESSVTWIKCQREYDDGRLEYDIEFTSGNTEYDVTVDAASGNILSYEAENLPGAQVPQISDIGSEAAIDIALTHAGVSRDAARGLKAERDNDHGRIVYEVEFKSGSIEYEYKIDAATGAVLEHEADIDD